MLTPDEIYLKSTNTAEEFIDQFMQCLEFEDYSIERNNDVLSVYRPEEFTLYLRKLDPEDAIKWVEPLPFTPTYRCHLQQPKYGDILGVKKELITAIIKYTKLMINDVLAYTDGDSDVIIYYNQSLILREDYWIWEDFPLNEIEYKFDKLPNI